AASSFPESASRSGLARDAGSRFPLRTARSFALAGFVVGLATAIHHAATLVHVREFQAGEGSRFTERALYVAMHATVDGLGLGLVGLALGALAQGLAALRPRRTGDDRLHSERIAHLVVAGAAFALWVWVGTWLGNEYLPFLDPLPLAALNLAGFAATLAASLAVFHLTRRIRFARGGAHGEEPIAVALLTMLAAGAGVYFALAILKHGGVSRGARIAMAAGCFALLFVAAGWLSRIATPPVAALRERLGSRPILPRIARGFLGVAFAACAIGALPFFRLHGDWQVERPVYPALPAHGAPKGPNVVLVVVDTLRADHLGCYGYERPTSPFLDSLAAEGARFADSTAPAAWTKPSTATILTGLHPSRHGALYHGSKLRVPEGGSTLAEAFRAAGYVTAGFVSNPNVKRIFDFDRGFDEFFDAPVEDTLTHAALRNSAFGAVATAITRHQFNWKNDNDASEINRHAIAWLEANHDRRFFLYVHYIDPHEPYSPPDSYARDFRRDPGRFLVHNERKKHVAMDLYDGEIRYTDDNLRALVGELKRHGIFDDTLFVLTSDHGEEFFEHGVLGHGFSLYQEVLHVPLLFHGPGVPKGRVVQGPVAIVDLAATLLDASGAGPDRFGDGRSFRAAMGDPAWKREGPIYLENEFGEDDRDLRSFVFAGIRDGARKLILTTRNAYRPPERHGGQELYDLAADPRETRNVFPVPTEPQSGDFTHPQHREAVEALLRRLQAHQEFLTKSGLREDAPPILDAETEAGLRAVGYLR
ncbi:MAG TPA: sulfatase, partial [Planctomycetota bacterium]|nr:sulfatase [Planctomycetota bacterium]